MDQMKRTTLVLPRTPLSLRTTTLVTRRNSSTFLPTATILLSEVKIMMKMTLVRLFHSKIVQLE